MTPASGATTLPGASTGTTVGRWCGALKDRLLEFSYRLRSTGWADAALSEGEQRLRMRVSYLSDALRDLSEATLRLLEGADHATFSWCDEPGEYRWHLWRQGETVALRVEWERGREEGRFGTTCPLGLFAGRVLAALEGILREKGIHWYRREWSQHDFPLAQYERLKALVPTAYQDRRFRYDPAAETRVPPPRYPTGFIPCTRGPGEAADSGARLCRIRWHPTRRRFEAAILTGPTGEWQPPKYYRASGSRVPTAMSRYWRTAPVEFSVQGASFEEVAALLSPYLDLPARTLANLLPDGLPPDAQADRSSEQVQDGNGSGPSGR
jgi:hypothetical protein